VLITCARCSTQFQLDDERVPVEGIRVRCSICKHAFFVSHPDSIEVEVEDPVERAVVDALAADAAAAADVAHDLDEPGPEAEPADESWEFDDDGLLSEAAERHAPERRFEESFEAARSAVDDLLGNSSPGLRAGPVPERPSEVRAPAEADAAETWSSPDAPVEPASAEPSEAAEAWESASKWDASAPSDAPASGVASSAWGEALDEPRAEEPVVEEPLAEPWDAADAAEPVPAAEESAAAQARAVADAAPSSIYEDVASDEAELPPGAEELEPDLDGEADLGLESEDEDPDLELDFEESGQAAVGSEGALALDDDAGLDAAWEDSGAALSPETGAAAQPRAWLGAQAERTRDVEVPIGLGAPLDLGGELRGMRALALRAGHAAGWAAVAVLVGAALWGTLAPRGTRQAAPAAQALAGLEATGITGRWVESALAGPVYVVSGELHNPGPEARAPGARLVVRLLDGVGASVAEAAASVSAPLGAARLREATPEELRAAAEQGARSLATTALAPGARVAFEAVLVALPEQARRFELAAIPLHEAAKDGG
jgi:predicted Zn finger-like uncharacterized protein